MIIQNATEVRRNWSKVTDHVIREKPQFIKRTRDCMVLTDVKLFENLLTIYRMTADKFVEDDNSITLSLRELDLAENASTEAEARRLLGQSVLDYAEDFYVEFALWSAAPNRKSHIPYVLKALIINDATKIGEAIECRAGKS
ncbi:MAG: hypothetical protein EOM59_08145 [Clostridia bacterium]|nr:hypothetical protein [Clostridia bacterium]